MPNFLTLKLRQRALRQIFRNRRRSIVIMVKEPRPGRAKTRLGRDLGMVCAAWWYRHQVGRLIRNLRDPRWRIVLAVSPDQATTNSYIWPRDLVRVPQGRGNLGDRMKRLLRSIPPMPVCIISSDTPAINRNTIWSAFRALGTADAVVGPTTDGGYWLIGLKGTRPLANDIFHGVRWSTPYALEDTIASLSGLHLEQIARLSDIDEASDLYPQASAKVQFCTLDKNREVIPNCYYL